VRETIELTRAAFEARRLHDAWRRVIAVVVQPSVEFGNDYVHDYDHDKAVELIAFIERQPDLVYEAHSTDYQAPDALRAMVVDHFAILKVGPWLTFAFREAAFALAEIERLWLGSRKGIRLSALIEVIDREMGLHPDHWRCHLEGEGGSAEVMRKYGFSDRIRYYWPRPEIAAAVHRLMENLGEYPPPLSLLSQYLPCQYEAVRGGRITKVPAELIRHKIGQVLSLYSAAAGMSGDV
jgi:D-tagatose-1,6-bisphosphate aldolase subunit GatZ/KbaZ